MNDFIKVSEEIANDFLQSIVFIDDKAYVDEKKNNLEFDAFQISQAFAKSKKGMCSL